MTINEIQDDLIDNFSILDGDRETTVFYIMELGQKMPQLAEEKKSENHLIKGCQSKVWLHSAFNDGKVQFEADSNTGVTKGLISMLVSVLSNQPAEDVAKADLYFIEKIGLGNFIGSQRSNGLVSMIKQMKMDALAYQAKI